MNLTKHIFGLIAFITSLLFSLQFAAADGQINPQVNQYNDTEKLKEIHSTSRAANFQKVLSVQGELVNSSPLLYTKFLTVHPKSIITLPFSANTPYYAVVVEVLQISDPKQPFTIRLGEPPAGFLNGKPGLPNGQQGAPGRTIDRPPLYIFIGKIEGPHGTIPSVGGPNLVGVRDLKIEIDGRGIRGGVGGVGGTGATGNDGNQGRHSRAKGPFCRRGCRPGSPGGKGGNGGRGGDGGPGGRGADIIVVGPDGIGQSLTFMSVNIDGGAGGFPGEGGGRGTGGRGGAGRDSNGPCDSCLAGRSGATGEKGDDGIPGAPGEPGKLYFANWWAP